MLQHMPEGGLSSLARFNYNISVGKAYKQTSNKSAHKRSKITPSPTLTADGTEQEVSWVFGTRRRFADLGAIDAGYSHKCPQALGVTSCSPRTDPCGDEELLIPCPTQDWGFSQELLPPGSRGSCLLGCSTHQPTAGGVLSPAWFPCGNSDDLQHLAWFFKRNFGNFCGEVVAGVALPTWGLASDAHPEPLWSTNRELRRIYTTLRELLRAVRVCSVIQLHKCANVLDKRF